MEYEVAEVPDATYAVLRQTAEFGEVHFVCVGTPQKSGEYAADMTYVETPPMAAIVVRPSVRGIAAATGLRNTSRSTSRSSGAAISSARLSASTDDLWMPLATSA